MESNATTTNSNTNSTNNSQSPSSLLSQIHGIVPNLELYDDSNGIYGELIYPQIVYQGLVATNGGGGGGLSNNVGKLDDPIKARAMQAVHSLTCHSFREEVQIRFDNITNTTIRIRWLDEYGRTFEYYNWYMEPYSTTTRYTRLGHLFLLSTTTTTIVPPQQSRTESQSQSQQQPQELLLGAYRIRMPLPSGSPHCIRIEQTGSDATMREGEDGDKKVKANSSSGSNNNNNDNDVTSSSNKNKNNNNNGISYIVESVLIDTTKQDELVVAAGALDASAASHQQEGSKHQRVKTISVLQKIITNVRDYPTDRKYHSLRLSNSTIQKYIVDNWNAMQILYIIGFSKKQQQQQHKQNMENNNSNGGDKDSNGNGNASASSATASAATPGDNNEPDDYLIWKLDDDAGLSKKRIQQACEVLEQLQFRCQSGFVAELAPSPPWQGPLLSSSSPSNHSSNNSNGGGGGGGGGFGTIGGRGFISDDEKWKRAERNAQRRARSGRRPDPGNAPSSKGNWGR